MAPVDQLIALLLEVIEKRQHRVQDLSRLVEQVPVHLVVHPSHILFLDVGRSLEVHRLVYLLP